MKMMSRQELEDTVQVELQLPRPSYLKVAHTLRACLVAVGDWHPVSHSRLYVPRRRYAILSYRTRHVSQLGRSG